MSIAIVVLLASVLGGQAQPAAIPGHQHDQHQHPGNTTPAAPAKPEMPMQMDMDMGMTGPLGITMAREGSGTSWLPDTTPMFVLHREAGPWSLMLHENVFVQYVNEGGDRGDTDFGSINWVMGMAHRKAAGGVLMFHGMASLEPATVGECGYPTLLATGEFCKDQPIHDRQHPHDLFMELATHYQREINSRWAYELYGAVAGEPAIGPPAYPHRPSSMPNPLAPIAHHWLDSTHISFGVITAGLFQRRWKIETSLFNGREPDQNRYDLDFAALDSVAGRVSFTPAERWALQFSAAHLNEAEQAHLGGPRHDVQRVTASAAYHRRSETGRFSATTIAWGRNSEEGIGTNALLAESSLSLDAHNTIFGRGEIAEKTGENLVVHELEEEILTVGKLQLGYLRQFAPRGSFVPGLGVSVSLSVVPDRLSPFYGGRRSAGVALFFNLRPSEMQMGGAMHHDHH